MSSEVQAFSVIEPAAQPAKHLAAMDNHLHVLVRLDPEVAAAWSDEEVVRRWDRLLSARDKSRKPLPSSERLVEQQLIHLALPFLKTGASGSPRERRRLFGHDAEPRPRRGRPVPVLYVAEHVPKGHEADRAAVARIAPVVAQHETHPVRHLRLGVVR
jgi:hypothetical protein